MKIPSLLLSFAVLTFSQAISLAYTDPFPVPSQPGLSVVAPSFQESFDSGSGTPGIIGKAAQPGVAVVHPTPSGLQGAKSAITIEFWSKGGALAGFLKGPGFEVTGQGNMGPFGSHMIRISLANDGVYVGDALSIIGLKESDTSWHHYVVATDGRYISSYVDGELLERHWLINSANQIGPMEDGSNVVETPQIQLNPSQTVDELRIYNKALSPAEVKRSFENYRRNTQILYASPSGNGNGSSASVPMSLSSALAALQPETRLVLAAGTYNGADFQVNGVSGASPERRALIIGESGTGPVIIRTVSGSTGPSIATGSWISVRNLRFVNESSGVAAALSIGSMTGPTEVDACEFISITAGLRVSSSDETTVQNSVVRAATDGLRFTDSERARVRNNTIYQGQTGLAFVTNSKFPRFVQNLLVGQTVKALLLDPSSASARMLADNNIYDPASGALLATVDGTDYSPAQFRNYQAKFLALVGGSGGNEGRTSRFPELQSFIADVTFENPAAGDLRLKRLPGNVTDAGTASLLADFGGEGVDPALWDATGAERPMPYPLDRATTAGGNAADVGAYETNSALTFSFNLPADRTASAGVYNAAGQMVATLFSGRPLKSGSQTIYWNGLNDQQQPASGAHTVRVLTNDVRYVWEGAVGNSSVPRNGPTALRLFFTPPAAMATDHQGSATYFALGYQEAFLPIWKMKNSNRSQIEARLGYQNGINSKVITDTATDGQRAYFVSSMGASASQPCAGFITAFNVSNNTPVTGGSWVSIQDTPYYGILVGTPQAEQEIAIGGVAVQNSGNLLFASVRGDNRVYVYHKATGAKQSFEITVSQPGDLAVDGRGDLWVTSGNTVQCFSSTNNWQSPVRTISNLSGPIALAWTSHTYGASGSVGTILVADGGSSQQVKAYNDNSVASLWTLGQAGGYANGIQVTNDKFEFGIPTPGNQALVPRTFLAAYPDGGFYLQEHATSRVMKFNAARAFQVNDTMSAMASFYASSSDANNPNRVFAGFLEYQIDYNTSFGVNNGSWTPVKYYGHAISGGNHGFSEGLINVATLSNGRTYAFSSALGEFVELTAQGLRETGLTAGFQTLGTPWQMQKDGSLTTTAPNGPLAPLYKRALTGFDSVGNPVWGTETKIGEVKFSSDALGSDPVYVEFREDSFSGLRITYNGGTNGGYHLGAVAPGSTDWQWRTAKATRLDGRGSWDSSGQFAGANQMAGVLDGQIFLVYRGEFWQSVQANQFMQYSTDGLFVGQFGITSQLGHDEGSVPGMSSNMMNVTAVKVGQKTYLYANDESSNSGLTRWRVDGLDSLQQYAGALTLGSTPTPTPTPTPSPTPTPTPPPGGGPAGYTYVADEGGSYTSSQPVDVAYGANGQFHYRYNVTGTIQFSNADFGGDPIAGVSKKGYYRLSGTPTPTPTPPPGPTPTPTPTPTPPPGPTPTPSPTPPPAQGPAGYTYVADENTLYTFNQPVNLAYGANGQFFYLMNVSGTISFDNAMFGGDPIVGVFKRGYYALATAPVITSPTTASGTVGTPVNYQIMAFGATGFSAGNLPSWLSVDANGFISGVPTAAGVYLINLSASSAAGTGTSVLALTISAEENAEGPSGYTYIADENDSHTFSQTVDVAYGANGTFHYLYGVTGAVTFNNNTFGDPITGVFKKGYYKVVSP